MATSGDPHLATSGDFFMAMDNRVGRRLVRKTCVAEPKSGNRGSLPT